MKSKPAAAAYRQLKNRLVVAPDGASPTPLVIVVVARKEGDGATTVARDLAREIAADEIRTALVTHRADGSPAQGGAGLAITRAYLDAWIQSETREVRYAAPASGMVMIEIAEPAVLRHPAWLEFRSTLLYQAEVFVVDAGAVSGMVIYSWAPCATRTVLVIDSLTTSLAELRRLRKELDDSKLRIDGAVLNRKMMYVPGFVYRRFR